MPFELKTQTVEFKKTRNATKTDIFMYKYSFLVLILIMAAVLAAGFFMILKPKYEEVLHNYNTEYENRSNESMILKTNVAKLTQYLVDYNSLSEYEKEMIYKMVPEKNQYEIIYAEMDKLITGQNLILRKVSVSQIEDDPRNLDISETAKKIGKTGVEIMVEGVNYDSMKRLLASIEKNMRLMDIQEIKFNPDSYSVSINFITYYSAK
jgi:Tfp pilus assembly protein PilO